MAIISVLLRWAQPRLKSFRISGLRSYRYVSILVLRRLHRSRPLARRTLLLLFLLGLAIRLGGAFLYGTQDMEFWKAYGTYTVQTSLLRMYGESDAEIYGAWQEHRPDLKAVRTETQNVISYRPYKYWRTEYIPCQPPIYMYSIWMCTHSYGVFSEQLDNTRLFNFFLNFAYVA